MVLVMFMIVVMIVEFLTGRIFNRIAFDHEFFLHGFLMVGVIAIMRMVRIAMVVCMGAGTVFMIVIRSAAPHKVEGACKQYENELFHHC